jgi:hypothetical protein
MVKSKRIDRKNSFLTSDGSAETLLMFGYNASSRSTKFCERAENEKKVLK